MTSLLLFIYLIDVVDGIKALLGGAALSLTIGSILVALCKKEIGRSYNTDWTPRLFRSCLIAVPILLLLSVLTPSKNGMLLMGGAVMADKALDSDTGKKVTYLLNQKLDQAIREAGDRK